MGTFKGKNRKPYKFVYVSGSGFVKLSILTGSVSRQAGGTFDAIRRPSSILSTEHKVTIQVLGTYDEDTEFDHLEWHPIAPETFAVKGPRSFGYTKNMATALERFQPDIQHVHGVWMHFSLVNHQYHCLNQTPYIISPHGMLDPWALDNSAWKKRFVGLAFENKHLAGASCIHALCAPELAAIRGYGLKNTVCVIPNGIDLPQRKAIDPPWSLQQHQGKKILLYLGRLHPKKGLVPLLHAWKQASVKNELSKEWLLVLAGWDQGGHEDELKKIVIELGLERTVIFPGPQFGDPKQACHENADAFVLPSFSEGLPMTVLEAWAYELPVLMTPQCNIPEGFKYDAAVNIKPDTNAIAIGLDQLFTMSDSQRAEMGCRGHALVQQKFTWGKVAAQFYETYCWILGGGTPPDTVVLSGEKSDGIDG
jgi:poly(glycerol-phosphate) alpha-glucosyltransferase